MEKLLNKNIKQTIPTYVVKFIIANIVVMFMVIITTLLLIIRGISIDNVYHIDYLVLGLFIVIGNIMLVITGIASIKDYRKAMYKRIEDIKNNDNNIRR